MVAIVVRMVRMMMVEFGRVWWVAGLGVLRWVQLVLLLPAPRLV